MGEAVILSAARTPTGRFLGALSPRSATALGGIAISAAIQRAGVEPAAVDEVIMGNVLSCGLGQAPARQAALAAGLSDSINAFAVNKVCGSGLKAVMLAAQAIHADEADLIVAGGMESMSNAPYLVRGLRTGVKMTHQTLEDAMIGDGLWCPFENQHMGMAAEHIARKFNITRRMQDEYALQSHLKAVAAQDAGAFDEEIVPVETAERKGPPVRVTADETPRRDTSLEKLAALRPVFQPEGGTVTAGNAPGVNDGAAAVVVASAAKARALARQPLARIVAYTAVGVAPIDIFYAPVLAVRKVLEKAGLALDQIEVLELNEAFSAQAAADIQELGVDPARVNKRGGAVALGHPIGASGARILTTLLHIMKNEGLKRGLASLCLGGGNAVAMVVER